jgi:cytochrome c biogenesis protein CcdA/thiol-disulfide isomerase/thioredoxin
LRAFLRRRLTYWPDEVDDLVRGVPVGKSCRKPIESRCEVALFVLSYLAGALTILAPCILPVVPFVFARVDRPFVRSGLPLLVGMVTSFVCVATLALIGGGWAARANEIGRTAAFVVLAAMGIALLFPIAAERWTRPLVALGSRLSDVARQDAQTTGRSVIPSFVLGAATGLLWAPCAGPVLGLVLTTAVLQGPGARTTLLLTAYAAGAATSIALALWAGGRVFATMKRSFRVGEWLRRGLGIAVLASVTAVAFGLDTGLLARLTPGGGNSIEQELLERLPAQHTWPAEAPSMTSQGSYELAKLQAVAADPSPRTSSAVLPVEGRLPDLSGATTWLNSTPLSRETLRGKVVLVDFWTFACVNCQRALPHVRAWAEKYRDQGLVVVGVHSPEFAFERDIANVKRAARDLGLQFPIAIDNDFAIWRAFSNQYWPAHYFVDAQGRIRFHHFGEGEYERSEEVIRQLLDEARTSSGAGVGAAKPSAVPGNPSGSEARGARRVLAAPARADAMVG